MKESNDDITETDIEALAVLCAEFPREDLPPDTNKLLERILNDPTKRKRLKVETLLYIRETVANAEYETKVMNKFLGY